MTPDQVMMVHGGTGANDLVIMSILEHGDKVRMVPTSFRTWSVDTPEDLARVEKLMTGDELMERYRRS